MKVYVRNEDLGFWTQTEVPVSIVNGYWSACCGAEVSETGFCDYCMEPTKAIPNIVYCNHAGAEEMTDEYDHVLPNGVDHSHVERILVCNKCEAWKFVYADDGWQDAPEDGRR